MTLHIASGECCAADLKKRLPNAEILPFNEAMCEGETALPVFGEEFCALRAAAYNVSREEYERKSPRAKLAEVHGYKTLELYFDDDMFCAVNCLTLLAYLEQESYGGDIYYNRVPQDGSAKVLTREKISVCGALKAFETVLIRREKISTGIPQYDKVLQMYLEYVKPDNEIVKYAEKRLAAPRYELIRDMLTEFRAYGLSDTAAEKFIARAQAKAAEHRV